MEYSVREQRGWYLYDWANSGFATTVIALFLGPYLTILAKAAADANGYVYFGGGDGVLYALNSKPAKDGDTNFIKKAW